MPRDRSPYRQIPDKLRHEKKKWHRTQRRDLLRAAESDIHVPANADELKLARVYANFGVESGVLYEGVLKRVANNRKYRAVVGDWVYTDGNVVLGIAPRGKVLARFAEETGVRVIAANLDQVGLVVSASVPPLQLSFVDRYVTYCRVVGLPLFLVLNKMDEALDDSVEQLLPYKEAGIDLFLASAAEGTGLKALEARLKKGVTVLGGMSGVGKTTLLNAILGEELPTQEVNERLKRGRHTTMVAEAFDIGKTLLIDTPGIRKFGLVGVEPRQVIKGFPDLEKYAPACHFADCMHEEEDGCAVRQAADDGDVNEERYIAYLELLDSLDKL